MLLLLVLLLLVRGDTSALGIPKVGLSVLTVMRPKGVGDPNVISLPILPVPKAAPLNEVLLKVEAVVEEVPQSTASAFPTAQPPVHDTFPKCW
jgi:hypothetical protein